MSDINLKTFIKLLPNGDLKITAPGSSVIIDDLVLDLSGDITVNDLTAEGSAIIGTATVSAPNSAADNLVIKGTGDTGITISTDGAGSDNCNIFFGDASNSLKGYIQYDHGLDRMFIGTNGLAALTLDVSQNATFAGDVATTGDVTAGTYSASSVPLAFNATGVAAGLNLFRQNATGPLTGAAAGDRFFIYNPSGAELRIGTDVSGTLLSLTNSGNITVSGTSLVNTDNVSSWTVSGGNGSSAGANIVFYGGAHATRPDEIVFRTGASERWKINASGNLIAMSANLIAQDDTASSMTFSGGNNYTDGSNIVLYGSTHATNANDVLFRSGSTVILQWENASSYWNFQGYQIRNVTDIYGGPDTQAMEIYGSTTTASANIVLYGGTHATRAFDMAFRFGGTESLFWDNSAAHWNFSGSPVVNIPYIHRASALNTLIMSGGSATTAGGNIVLYGESHATNASDIVFRSSGTSRLAWDHSANNWDFQALNQTGVTGLSRGATTGDVRLSGGSTNDLGASIVLFGESHASRANDILFRNGGTEIAFWDASSGWWDYNDGILYGVDQIIRGSTTDLLVLAGGSTSGLGGRVALYSETHATKARDIEFYEDGTLVLNWDNSNGFWNFQGNPIVQPNEIYQGTSTGNMKLSGGLTTSLGGNIVLYGETHATQANDILLRTGTTVKLQWDDSASYWNFQSTNIYNVADIIRGSTNSSMVISAGSTSSLGGNFVIYSESHASKPGYIELRDDTTVVFAWNSTDLTANGNNIKNVNSIELGSGGPTINTGSGSPEGVVTAPVGSTYHRTDGGAGTSFYVKESGAGNTGWVGK